MPITIRELVIRTIVTEPEGRASLDDGEDESPAPEIESLIQECVTQVMERLREQQER